MQVLVTIIIECLISKKILDNFPNLQYNKEKGEINMKNILNFLLSVLIKIFLFLILIIAIIIMIPIFIIALPFIIIIGIFEENY